MSCAVIILFALFGMTGVCCISLLVAVWIDAVKISDKEPE